MYHILIGVRSIEGKCLYGHKPGDEILYDGATFHGPLCDGACASMMPTVYSMRYGAEFPWMHDDVVAFACPDPVNRVVFLLQRVPQDSNPDAFQLVVA